MANYTKLSSCVMLVIIWCAIVTANPVDNDEDNNIESDYFQGNVNETKSTQRTIDGVLIYPNEPRCRNVGGFCVEKSNCAKGALVSATGLCPKHSSNGVECCFELIPKKSECIQHLGECMKRCHKTLQRPSTDCRDIGEVCCVLVT